MICVRQCCATKVYEPGRLLTLISPATRSKSLSERPLPDAETQVLLALATRWQMVAICTAETAAAVMPRVVRGAVSKPTLPG